MTAIQICALIAFTLLVGLTYWAWSATEARLTLHRRLKNQLAIEYRRKAA